MNARLDSPVPGVQGTSEDEDLKVVSFTPVESGWVMIVHANELDDGERRLVHVYPMVGWVLLESAEGLRDIAAVSNYSDWDSHTVSEVYFSRQLFREAQGEDLVMSRKLLRKAVSE